MSINPFRRRDRDRGATLVEASLVFPILILIVMAILELGMLFKDYLSVSYLSREGARIGALVGDDPDADCSILMGLESLASPGDLARLHPIEIYLADTDGTMLAGPNTATFKNNGDPAQCTAPVQDPNDTWVVNSLPWLPTTRGVDVGPDLTPDILGIRLRMTHDWITGFPPFRGSVEIDERTITRLEPKAFWPTPP